MYKKANLAKGTLSAQLLVAGTSLVLQTDEGLKFPNTGSGNLFVGVIWGAAYSSPEADATHEFVEAYRSSGDTFTIVRAKESTSAKQWEIGDNFMLTASKAVFDEYETALGDKADKTNVLELDNTDAFTPDADYEPATKKYVDDNIPAIPVKATGTEIDTGEDDVKFATAKALADQTVLLKKSGGTMTGDIQLGETDIKLDAVLSGDEKWSGIVISGTAGAQLVVGEVCYLDSSGKWLKVDGILDGTDTGFSKELGMCVLAASGDNEPTELLKYGKIRSAKFPALTKGSPAYLSDTAGEIVVAQPTTTNFAIRIVGEAITEEDLLFNPSNEWMVHI